MPNINSDRLVTTLMVFPSSKAKLKLDVEMQKPPIFFANFQIVRKRFVAEVVGVVLNHDKPVTF